MLDDKSIRKTLIDFLDRKKPEPRLIVEELGIHNRNAIADVVAIYDSLHGFEIKGESDNVSRITKQSLYYNLSFSKLTLVTTQNHLVWARQNLPEFWGIALAKQSTAGGIKISYQRPAKNNPFFSKETSLLMLWKAELLSSELQKYELRIKKNHSRADLALKISSRLRKHEILSFLATSIISRKSLKTVDNECDVRGQSGF